MKTEPEISALICYEAPVSNGHVSGHAYVRMFGFTKENLLVFEEKLADDIRQNGQDLTGKIIFRSITRLDLPTNPP